MIYTAIYKEPFRRCQLETYDGVVIATTPYLRWTIGHNIDFVEHWLYLRGWDVRLRRDGKRLPALTESLHQFKLIAMSIAESE